MYNDDKKMVILLRSDKVDWNRATEWIHVRLVTQLITEMKGFSQRPAPEEDVIHLIQLILPLRGRPEEG